MRDQLQLLLTALICAAIAAAFFRFAGQDAWTVILAIFVIGTTADNARLRRENRRLSVQIAASAANGSAPAP